MQEYMLGGRNIAEVLAMSVSEADSLFGNGEARLPAAHKFLSRLIGSGKSVVIIEHHQAVMAHADWIVDLGPGADEGGCRTVFEGTPADPAAARSTFTGEHVGA